MTKNHTIAFLLCAAAAAACGHAYSETAATTTTAARPAAPASQESIEAITSARCDREARCDNVGANRHYVSNDGCMTQLRGEAMNQLTTSTCPNGIDKAQLGKCLADIRGERCENLLDTLDRQATCTTSSLCSR